MTESRPDPCDLSVIMPAYQAASTIRRALSSIAAQTLKPREVIIVDDGSTDGTLDLARDFIPAMHEIPVKLHRQANLGPGAARNKALLAARGRFISFLDADDEWLPTKLERSLAVLRRGGFRMVAHDILLVRNGHEIRVDCCRRWAEAPATPFLTLYRRGYISCSTVVAERELLLAIGGFNSTLRSGQDYDLWLAALAHIDDRFTMFDEALLRYFPVEGGITSRTESRRHNDLITLRAHLSNLRRRTTAWIWPVLLRTFLVQVTAAREHFHRKRVSAAALCLGGVLPECFRSLRAASRNEVPRQNYLLDVPGEGAPPP